MPFTPFTAQKFHDVCDQSYFGSHRLKSDTERGSLYETRIIYIHILERRRHFYMIRQNKRATEFDEPGVCNIIWCCEQKEHYF